MTTKVKICGLKTPEAVEAAVTAGADYIGLVFFEKSPRNVSIKQAKDLTRLARELSPHVKIVALLVDPADSDVRAVARAVEPDYLQLHGRESPERVSEIKAMTGIAIIKAAGITTSDDVQSAMQYDQVADLLLFDAKAPKGAATPGGNGIAFDWQALEPAQGQIGFVLSGGLTPDNVAAAIKLVGPMAVDVSSGVEASQGTKDPELIRHFLAAVKTARS